MGARVAAHLEEAVRRGDRLDAAARLDDLLLDRAPERGDEHLVLPVRAHERRPDGHVGVLHAVLRLQAEVDLVRDRDREGVAFERRSVLRGRRLDRRERAAVAAGSRLRERRRAERRLAGARVGRTPVARESPRPVDEDTDADALAVEVADLLDLAVLGRDELGAAHDHARVGVLGAGADRRIDRCLAEEPHPHAYLRKSRPRAASVHALERT